MALYLEVLKGESLGSKFPIKEGARIGRTTGEILLPDRKISSLHAQIEKHEDRFVLVDRGSSNGLLINQQRVPSVVLMPGVRFVVGKTQLGVIELSEELESTKLSTFDGHQAEKKDWKEILHEQIPLVLMENCGSQINVQPFSPAIQFDFIQGPETDRSVLLGYGPRKFGSSVLDIELFDKLAPFLAFEIIPEGNRARIVTKEFEAVQLNQRRFSEEYLKNGDLIQIGSSVIRVSFQSVE